MSTSDEWMRSLKDKSGRMLLPILEDMHGRANAVLICNLGGDDPIAPISAHLINQHDDQLVLGIRFFAEATGCRDVILYAGTTEVGLIADRLSASGNLTVTVKSGPSSPVLREMTALYSVMDTGIIWTNKAEEDFKREFLSYGYQGRPTLVLDGETAYQASRLQEDGHAPLTKHVAVIAGDTSIKEVPVGITASVLTENLDCVNKVLIGGVWGSFVRHDDLTAVKVSYSDTWNSFRIFKDKDCVVHALTLLYQDIRELSCAKCVMCREGSWQIHAIFNDMTEGKASRDDIGLIEDIGPLIAAGSLCDFGRYMVTPALTAVSVCRDEVNEHVIGKNCAAGICTGLLSYLIDPSLCTGCGECSDVCPEEAIEGQDGFIYMIDQKLCVKCGKCVPVCAEGAIKYGGEKFKVPKKLTRVGRFH